jgi:hypothetical protein
MDNTNTKVGSVEKKIETKKRKEGREREKGKERGRLGAVGSGL